MRHQSYYSSDMSPSKIDCYEMETEFQQQVSSYEETVDQLDVFYGISS